MATAKKKWVAFRTNATIPAAVTGEDADLKVNIGAPIALPEAYADHVVHDRFADFCEPPKKSGGRKKAAPKPTGDGQPTGNAQHMAAAQKAVDAAEEHLKAVTGTDQEEAAQAALEAAEAALDALLAAD